MSNHPRRFYETNDLHFINCSCYHRQPWLARAARRDLFLKVFEQVRQRYEFVVVGYVVMPEHIHLLISKPERGDPSTVMQAIKQGFARRVLNGLRRRRMAAQPPLLRLQRAHGAQAQGEIALYASESGEAGLGAGSRAVALEQLSELCFRRTGRRAN